MDPSPAASAKRFPSIGNLLFTLQEAFVALLPYLLLSAATSVLAQGFVTYQWSLGPLQADTVMSTAYVLRGLFPLLLVISIAYHLARAHAMDAAITVLLSIVVYLGQDALRGITAQPPSHLPLSALLTPLVAVGLLRAVMKLPFTRVVRYRSMNHHVAAALNHGLPFTLVFVLATAAMMVIHFTLGKTAAGVTSMVGDLHLSNGALLIANSVISHLLWFVGLHGNNVFDLLVDSRSLEQSLFPNLSYYKFLDLFAGFGGAGAGLSLMIAILIVARDRHSRIIARTAAPFLVCNVTEVLIYGLPIVFNRRLLVPFVGVPLLNMGIAYVVLAQGWITFNGRSTSWITPIFLDSYLMTGGLRAALLQAVLLIVSVLVYIPFVRRFSASQSNRMLRETLASRLGIEGDLQVRQGASFQQAQSFILRSNIETQRVIELITANQLTLYYQPKIRASDQRCLGFEALLRLECGDGRVVGPYFLETLELAGLASVIDLWVCNEARRTLNAWDVAGFHPHVAINLHPDTLGNPHCIDRILATLSGRRVEFEIIERAFATSPAMAEGIRRLRASGLRISIDDFGTGYSSLHSLYHLDADTIKLDKSLIDIVHTERGYAIYRAICALCKELEFELIAEGVETEAQFVLAKRLGVDAVQGWCFAPALSAEKAREYAVAHG